MKNEIESAYKQGYELGKHHGYNEGYTDGVLKEKHKYREGELPGEFICKKCDNFAEIGEAVCAECALSDLKDLVVTSEEIANAPYLKQGTGATTTKIGNIRF